MNLKYAIEYEYDESYSCEESGCGQICRCMEIRDPRLTSIRMVDLVEIVYDKLLPKDALTLKRNKKINHILQTGDMDLLDQYCLHRILTIFRAWSPESYQFEIRGGYYGDEVGEVKFGDEEKILQTCREMYNFDTPREKINFVLELEYGKLIHNIRGVKLIRIDLKDLKFINTNHFQKIKKEIHYNSENYLLPRGLVKSVGGGKYTIVDGYHRIKSSDLDEIIVWEITE